MFPPLPADELERARRPATSPAMGPAKSSPGGGAAGPLALQRTAGNQATGGLLAPPGVLQLKPQVTQSAVEIALAAFLEREWDRQSERKKPFRITPAVRQAFELIFSETPAGVATVASDLQHDVDTPRILLDAVRGKLPANVEPRVLDAVNKLPAPAGPKVEKISGPEASKTDEAAIAALKEAARRFLETPVGQQLARKVKEFVLSKDGIPLVVIAGAGGLTFVAANDPRVSLGPEIDLGAGVKLKFEYEGRVSDLPPLVRQLVGRPDATRAEPGKPREEVKAGISVSFDLDKIGEFARAVGHFFAVVGTAIGKGIVKVGSFIALVGKTILPELLATAGGAALGALIGFAAGGGAGAALGALIGGGIGLVGALVGRLIKAVTS